MFHHLSMWQIAYVHMFAPHASYWFFVDALVLEQSCFVNDRCWNMSTWSTWVLPSVCACYSTQYGLLQYHTTCWVLQGALRIKTRIQFTRWTWILFIIGQESTPNSLSTHAEDFHLTSFKESSANKQGPTLRAMVFIIIGIHIQFSTSCFIFVNFVPRLILLYIDSHPPGWFAAICVWLLPVWLMRCCGLLRLLSYSETEAVLYNVKTPHDV